MSKIWLFVLVCVAAVGLAVNAATQNALLGSQLHRHSAASSEGQSPRGQVNSDSSLEIAPRSAAPPSTNIAPESVPTDSGDFSTTQQELPPVPTSGPPASMVSAVPHQSLPFLGISVQRIESHATPGRDIEGLEIVSVDPGSPAELAGLKGRGPMTKLGASGATAGALMAPLDIALMPLLKKAGQLGHTGDLIVAIDDRRVTSEVDLTIALTDSKPGDTIYLTIVRLTDGGAHQTIKIPVKLGEPASVQ